MSHISLSDDEFQPLVQPLLGLEVAHPWKGYGSAIFLELGALAPPGSERLHHPKGEACICIEWDWRVEAELRVLFGSSNSRPKIQSGLLSLQGTTVEAISVVGEIPELVVHFSNGHCLRSMVMVTGNPQWSIRLPDGLYLYSWKDHLIKGTGSTPAKEHEVAHLASADHAAAARWGVPSAYPERGKCKDCVSFVRLDGDGPLLNYGCCTAESSPFDGRVVMRDSGCPAFTEP